MGHTFFFIFKMWWRCEFWNWRWTRIERTLDQWNCFLHKLSSSSVESIVMLMTWAPTHIYDIFNSVFVWIVETLRLSDDAIANIVSKKVVDLMNRVELLIITSSNKEKTNKIQRKIEKLNHMSWMERVSSIYFHQYLLSSCIKRFNCSTFPA